jgi:Putative Actinobacterial Holin-X, holin superfamily III
MTPFAVLTSVGALQQFRATINGWSHRLAVAGVYGVVAFVFAVIAIGFLAAALFFALVDSTSPVIAALIVAVVLLALATGAGLLARHAISRGRGGTGTRLPAAQPLSPLGAVGGLDTNTLFALGAGIVGGLIATQLRSRGVRAEVKKD